VGLELSKVQCDAGRRESKEYSVEAKSSSGNCLTASVGRRSARLVIKEQKSEVLSSALGERRGAARRGEEGFSGG